MKNKSSGFTLIEVLIALAILSIALMALIKVVGQSINSAAHVKNKIAAHLVAMNILAEIQVGLIDLPQQKSIEGVSNMLGSVWRWQVKVEKESDKFYARLQVRVRTPVTDQVLDSIEGFVAKTQKD